MIKLIKFNFKLWVFTIGLIMSTNNLMAADKVFPNLQVKEQNSTNDVTFDSLRPSSNHVVMILEAYSPNSFAILNALRKNEYDGTGLIIIIASTSVQANAFIKDQKVLLPSATWLHQTAQILMPALALNGMPFLFGNDANNQIKWHYAGVPMPLEKTLPFVRDWVNKPQTSGIVAPTRR